jgi:hypothetical protein
VKSTRAASDARGPLPSLLPSGAVFAPRQRDVLNGVDAMADRHDARHQHRDGEEDGQTGTAKKIMMPMPPTSPVSRVSSESIQVEAPAQCAQTFMSVVLPAFFGFFWKGLGYQPKTFWTSVRYVPYRRSAALQIEPLDNRPARRWGKR